MNVEAIEPTCGTRASASEASFLAFRPSRPYALPGAITSHRNTNTSHRGPNASHNKHRQRAGGNDPEAGRHVDLALRAARAAAHPGLEQGQAAWRAAGALQRRVQVRGWVDRSGRVVESNKMRARLLLQEQGSWKAGGWGCNPGHAGCLAAASRAASRHVASLSFPPPGCWNCFLSPAPASKGALVTPSTPS